MDDEQRYRSSCEDDWFLNRVDYSASPIRESLVQSNLNEHTQHEASTEVVIQAQAKTPSQANATERPSELEPSVQRTSPPFTRAEKGKAGAVDLDEEPLSEKQDKLIDREIAELTAKLTESRRI